MLSKNTAYLSRLDHLRFFAALLVAAYHFHGGPALNTSFNPITVFVREGEAGVSLFMVLSGFILTVIALGKQIDYKGFMYNRFLRIYPLYIIMVMIAAYASNRTVDFIQLVQLASPFANIGQVLGGTKLPHLWTIAVEFQFYLLFPFVIRFVSVYGLKYILALMLFVLFVRGVLFVRDTTVIDAAYSTIIGRIDQFCVGILAAMFYKSKKQWLSSPYVLVLCLAGVYVWFVLFSKITNGGYYGDASAYSPIWIVSPAVEALVWAALTLSYLQQKWQLPKFLNKALCYLGGISFSMYAWHFPIVQAFGKLSPLLSFVSWYWVFLFVVFPVIVAVSSISYYLIEKPFFSMRTSYIKGMPKAGDGSAVLSRSLD